MDLEKLWQHATELLKASHDVWDSPELHEVFPDGLERAASAIVATIDSQSVRWVETRADLTAPKVEAAVFSDNLVAHVMLTAEGFGFDVRKLEIESLRATSTPRVHAGPDGNAPFRFTARVSALELSFPWDSDNMKQDDRIAKQFAWLRDKL